jgi:hypothetical protein
MPSGAFSLAARRDVIPVLETHFSVFAIAMLQRSMK